MIAVEDLAVERGGVEVLADVSLAVEEGSSSRWSARTGPGSPRC
ncbi:hypothetical protein [Halosegnis marinus]